MIYAPVVIPTLCRYRHLKRGLDSLARNSWAKLTDIFVVLDFPPSDKYREGYEKTRDMLRSYPGEAFKSFNVVEREVNYGPGKNGKALIDEVIVPRYGRWMSAEDDIEFAPNFIEYMDKCLDYFEDDDSVQAVCGYSYPLDWEMTDGATVFLSQATYSAWGTGQWARKRDAAVKDIAEGHYLLNNRARAFDSGLVDRMAAGRRAEYVSYVSLGVGDAEMESMTDMAYGPYLLLSGKRVVVPEVSKTRNLGFDGTGLNCSAVEDAKGTHSMDYDYSHQPLDASDVFELVVEGDEECVRANHELLDKFLYVPQSKARFERLGTLVYRVFGAKGCDAATKAYHALRAAYRKVKA